MPEFTLRTELLPTAAETEVKVLMDHDQALTALEKPASPFRWESPFFAQQPTVSEAGRVSASECRQPVRHSRPRPEDSVDRVSKGGGRDCPSHPVVHQSSPVYDGWTLQRRRLPQVGMRLANR